MTRRWRLMNLKSPGPGPVVVTREASRIISRDVARSYFRRAFGSRCEGRDVSFIEEKVASAERRLHR